MSPARRTAHRRNWPRGLYEPRPGYYTWRNPRTGETIAIGSVPLASAINQVHMANAHVLRSAPTLIDKLTGKTETIAELLTHMPAATAYNTAKSWRSLDKAIKAGVGKKTCGGLTVKDCSDLIEGYAAAGKGRMAQALRTRLIAVCQKGMAKGWMASNPAEVTERPDVTVKRDRLTLEQFNAILAVADQVAGWLPLAMLLALVTGQDRSTVATMQRSMVQTLDGEKFLIVQRSKTRKTNAPVAIPLRLRLDVLGLSLADLLARRTGVVSPYYVHHLQPFGNAPVGTPVHPDKVSHHFTEARALAGIPDVMPNGKTAPTFHELRSLCKRLYERQGGVDTKALLGHASDKTAAIYADARGVEALRVSVA